MSKRFFRLADWTIDIDPQTESSDIFRQYIPNFLPFEIKEEDADEQSHLFSFLIDNGIASLKEEYAEKSSLFENTNGKIFIHLSEEKEYTFVIKDMHDDYCAILMCNKGFSSFRCALFGDADSRIYGLSNALMLAFVHSGSQRQTVVIHASMIRHEGYSYCFVAKSGTGKSTQSANWLKVIPQTDLMNDDNPLLRIQNGVVWSYGSPWSGKTPCYRDVKAPLGGIVNIMRSKENHVEQLKDVFAYGRILPSFSCMKSDAVKYREVCQTVEGIVSSVGIYNLFCTQYPESAIVCHDAVCVNKKHHSR